VALCPTSNGFTVAAGEAARAASTTSVNPEVEVSPRPSVTVTAIGKDPDAVGVQLNDGDELLHPGGNPTQEYAYVPEPPVGPTVPIVVVCPRSIGFGWAEVGPAPTAGWTTSVKEEVAFSPKASVTVRVTRNVPNPVGVQLNDAVAPLHPGAKPVHTYVYDPEPPEAPLVPRVVLWPRSIGFGLADTAPALTPGLTTSVNDVFAQPPSLSETFTQTG